MTTKGKARAPVKADLSAAVARALFAYEPETGVLRWKVDQLRGANRHAFIRAGDVAGHVMRNGYVAVTYKRRIYAAHRLIWLIVHGRWPADQIDHVNGKRSDNRLANLREATQSQNQGNRRRPKNNKSGFAGVRQGRDGRWHAYIWRDGRQRRLGQFSTKAEAVTARKAAEQAQFGEFRPLNDAARSACD